MTQRLLVLVLSAALLGASTTASSRPPAGEKLGTVHFPISCAAVQLKFDRAVALLHNFFYPETVKAFEEIIRDDPNCAMAYWGLAMSQRPNPLVPPFPDANLKAGWQAIQAGKTARTQAPREAEYLAAMEIFYQGYETIAQHTRTDRYAQAMRRIHEHYPADSEAAIFYALALNEAADLSDKSFANQLKAAAILNEERRKQPNHPGIAHYLIHSYDFAPLAARGVPHAHLYDQIAASSPHALHMPSHTYAMLGMWEDSIRANRAAAAAAAEYAAKNFPDATDPTVPHVMDFLVDAYLQLSRDTQARQVVNAAAHLKKFASVRLTVDTALAAIPARFALERGRWEDAARLSVHDSPYLPAQSITYFARALGSARSGHPDTASVDIERLAEIGVKLAASKDDFWAGQTLNQKLAAEAWVLFDQGQREQAIITMRKAADLDDASGKNVAMENKIVPMRALLGELYVAEGMNKLALAAFETSLSSNPNRFRSIAGAAVAAREAGYVGAAKHYYQSLIELARSGDGDRPQLVEAKAYLKLK